MSLLVRIGLGAAALAVIVAFLSLLPALPPQAHDAFVDVFKYFKALDGSVIPVSTILAILGIRFTIELAWLSIDAAKWLWSQFNGNN